MASSNSPDQSGRVLAEPAAVRPEAEAGKYVLIERFLGREVDPNNFWLQDDAVRKFCF